MVATLYNKGASASGIIEGSLLKTRPKDTAVESVVGVGYYVTQLFSRHGYFRKFFHKIVKADRLTVCTARVSLTLQTTLSLPTTGSTTRRASLMPEVGPLAANTIMKTMLHGPCSMVHAPWKS